MQALSGLDAAFLYLETNKIPMHIGGVAILEKELLSESISKNTTEDSTTEANTLQTNPIEAKKTEAKKIEESPTNKQESKAE